MSNSAWPLIAALAVGAAVGAGGGYAAAKGASGGAGGATAEMCGKDAFVPAGGGVTAPVTTPSGLVWQTVKAGTGNKPTNQDVVLVAYHGTVKDGSTFDANGQAPMPVSGVVPGFSEALKLMQKGGIYRICIPGKLAYGDKSPTPKIAPNAALRFEVELFEFKSMAEVEAMQKQMMEAQKGAGAPPPPQPQR